MDLQARADHLARLMEEKLDIRGAGLEAKLHRAGRSLPKYIRTQAGALVKALVHEGHPKLAPQVDHDRLERAYKDVARYLNKVDPWARRRAIFLNWLAGLVFSLLTLGALTVAFLRWRGLL